MVVGFWATAIVGAAKATVVAAVVRRVRRVRDMSVSFRRRSVDVAV